MRLTKINSRKILFLLISISTVFQVIFFYAVRINFECDSAAYYNSAVGYFTQNMNLVSPYRGPVYPLFLRLFGITTSGSIYPLLIFQASLGVLMPVLIYLILTKYGKVNAVLGYIVFLASTISFTSAKLILAEQIFITLVILAIFYLQKYLISKKLIYLYLFCTFAILGSLTRWEGLALIVAVSLSFIVRSMLVRDFAKPTAILLIIISLSLTGYSAIRAYQYDDIKMFGLQNGTGSQWLWRQYYSQGFRDFAGEIKDATGAFRGDSIQYIYNTTIDYVLQNDSEFEALKVTSTDNKEVNQNTVTGFQNEKNNIELLVNEAWKTPTTSGSHISFLMSRAIISKHGLVEGDKILQKGALNILLNEPQAQLVVLQQGLAMIGVGSFKFTEKIQWFEGPPINIGGCLNNTGNENFIKNHNEIYKFYSSTVHRIASEVRNLIRASFPLLLLITLAQGILRKKIEIMYIILTLATASNIAIVSLTGGGPYGKYDLTIFSYLILAIFCQIDLTKLPSWKRLKIKRFDKNV